MPNAIELVVTPTPRDIGEFTVRRASSIGRARGEEDDRESDDRPEQRHERAEEVRLRDVVSLRDLREEIAVQVLPSQGIGSLCAERTAQLHVV